MSRTLDLGSIKTRLQRIGRKAKESPDLVFTSIAHNIDLVLLWEALWGTRKDGAVGIDGVTWKAYKSNGQENLKDLLERFKSGSYKAPPGKRAYIPKADGKRRPIAISALEDKVLQRAVVMATEAVYEQDFYDFSYGFRPGRSSHQALKDVTQSLKETQGGWVLEVDVKGFFDAIDHRRLREILDLRMRDGVIRRMIDKWLRAGVLEEGEVNHSASGTPQGGVASPLLANIYLHEVLDKWFVEMVKPRLKGWSRIFRYADDFILIFEKESDARRVEEVVAKRFAKYHLEVHPDKTRLIDFRHPEAKSNGEQREPGSFDFLGFTFHWTQAQKSKRWFIRRKTAKKKLKLAFAKMTDWCRKNRHRPFREQAKTMAAKLRGHYAYYGIYGNSKSIREFRYQAIRIWKKWLSRRSQKRTLNWKGMGGMVERARLPPARIVHMTI